MGPAILAPGSGESNGGVRQKRSLTVANELADGTGGFLLVSGFRGHVDLPFST